MILCEWDAPEGDPRQSCIHLFAHILSTSFTSVSIFSVCCYSSVSISMVCPLSWSIHYNLAGEGYTESTCCCVISKIFRHGNKKTLVLVMVYSELFNNVCKALNLL
jgi:hypothetical protein